MFKNSLSKISGSQRAKKASRRIHRCQVGVEALEDRSVPASFTPGDLAVFLADSSTVSNTSFHIVEVNPTTPASNPVQSIAIASPLRASGSASSTGYLSLSNDGSYLAFDVANTTNTSVNTNTILPRSVGTLDLGGNFAIAANYTGINGNQPRGATSIDNSNWFIGDQGGVYTNNATTPTPAGNVRATKAFGGTVYALQQASSTSTPPVVSTFSTSGSGSFTGLPGLTSDTLAVDFTLVSSGANGSAFDVLYITDDTNATSGAIKKFALIGGNWTAEGTATTTGMFGIAAAKDPVAGFDLYVTTGNGSSGSNLVDKFVDSAAWNAPISLPPTPTVLLTAATATTFKGIAFVPTVAASTTTVSSSTGGTAVFGTGVSFTATITSDGNPVTSGNVQFSVDGTPVGVPVPVNGSGQATSAAISNLQVTGSPHVVTASYLGSAGSFGTSIGTLAGGQSVTQAGSSTTATWADGASVTFDANAHGATASWTSTGADGMGGPLPVTYVGISGTTYGPTSMAPSAVGNYQASASFAGDANHAASSNSANFTINPASLILVKSVALQPSTNLAIDNDFTRFANAFDSIAAGGTVQIQGILDWSEPNALASWQATGEAFAMPHLDGITVVGFPNSGVNGPGDDPTVQGEGPFYFDGLGTDKSWNISALQISNFDTAFFYSPEVDVTSYSGTHITNNTITVPNANPGAQNGGIILGPSPNQTIQGNTINIAAGGGTTSASFGIDSFTFGGSGAWNNLLIDNNDITVTTAAANAKVIGIAENSGSTNSNITVTNNTFNGNMGFLASNQQVAFGITSQNSTTGAVVYTGNTIHGAHDGFVWGDPEASPPYVFNGPNNIPIAFSSTTITDVGTGFVARDGGTATIDTTEMVNTAVFNYGTAFSADGNGTVITVNESVANFGGGFSSLASETNGGLVIFQFESAGVQNVSKAEGNSGFTLFSFPVTLAAPLASNQMFTVDYLTANGTADGNDYNTASGTLTILPGQISGTIAVKVLGDFNPEPDETFFVNLSNPTLFTNGAPRAANLASTQAVGTIQNDDFTTLSASIADATATKSATMGAQTLMTFAATLNSAPPAGEFFTVNYHATNGTAHGNTDFLAPDGTLTFLAGSTTPLSPLTVTVIGSPAMNPPETFSVTLDTPQLHFNGFSQTIPGNIGNGSATGTLDSPPPSGAVVSINNVSHLEGTPIPGNSASNFTTYTFTISYTGTLTTSIKVNWATANGSANGSDYQGNSGQVTLTPSVTSQTISVTVFADKTVEPDETFFVNLTNPGLNGFSNYMLGASTGTGTIVNDD